MNLSTIQPNSHLRFILSEKSEPVAENYPSYSFYLVASTIGTSLSEIQGILNSLNYCYELIKSLNHFLVKYFFVTVNSSLFGKKKFIKIFFHHHKWPKKKNLICERKKIEECFWVFSDSTKICFLLQKKNIYNWHQIGPTSD